MKKFSFAIFKLFPFILAIIFLVPLLAACSVPSTTGTQKDTEGIDEKNPPVQSYSTARYDGCIYGDYYFFVYYGKLYYYKLNNVQNDPIPVYFDPLASGIDNPFTDFGSISFFAVDTVASTKNGGVPVLLFAGVYSYTVKTPANPNHVIVKHRIGSFDMKTQKLVILKDEIDGTPMNFAIYENRILYVIHTEENGSSLYSLSTSDGEDEKCLPNPDKTVFNLLYAWDGRIYYYMKANDATLLSCNMDFEDQRSHFAIEVYPDPFIIDGKIYYGVQNPISTPENGNVVHSYKICCRDLSNAEEEKTVLTDVLAGTLFGKSYFYYSASDYNAETSGYHVLYRLDLNTGESRKVFEKTNTRRSYFIQSLNEKWIVFAETDLKGTGNTERIFCLDTESGKETLLPKNHLNW